MTVKLSDLEDDVVVFDGLDAMWLLHSLGK